MRRDPADLTTTRYDLLVIGGGVHGLFAAYDAAARGLSVALAERGDFGGGLSFNHQRTIHGGLRDVARGRFTKARAQILERRRWAQMTPHLIRPLPFLVGTYGWATRSKAAMKAGFAVYDWLGRSRNTDVPTELHLPKGRLESRATTARLFAGVTTRGLTGGAVWYDYQTLHPDRLTVTVALAAIQAGAALSNYAEAVGPLTESGRVVGARVKDLVTGAEVDVQAAVTLFAAGSGLGALTTAFGVTGAPPLLRAMNMLVDRPARDIAVAARGPSGRMLTLVPWRGYALVGTHQSTNIVAGPESSPPADAVNQMLEDVNATFPTLQAGRSDIRVVHHGLVPATVNGDQADLTSEPEVVRFAGHGGLVGIIGVKFTTARLAAERAVDAVCRDLGRRTRPCRTGLAPLPHAGLADVEGRVTEALRSAGVALDRDIADHLASVYGTEAPAVIEFSVSRGLLDRVAPGTAVIAGEIAYAAVHAGAVRLSDAVLRRTPLGATGRPSQAALERAATIMGEIRGWTAERRAQEIQAVEERFQISSH